MLEELVGSSTAIERAIKGEELTFDDGMEILNDDNLHVVGAAADIVRKKLVGDTVSFAASYYMNYTNLCAASCQMCAFYRKGGEDDAYTLTPDQIEKRVAAAKDLGATEVHIVGGFHPDLQLDYYEQMMSAIKQKHPDMTIKAFTAAEIFFLSKLTKNSIPEILSRLKAAGLDSMPGGGAELFHPDVRSKIIRGKCTGQQWLDTIEVAHNLGIKSNVTMLYGHIEKPEHVVGNGDITSPEIAKKVLDYTECDYLMIGRGAMGNPFIFEQINDYLESGVYKKYTLTDRLEAFVMYLELTEKYHIRFANIKQQAIRFTKGTVGGGQLRNRLSAATNTDDLKELLLQKVTV